MPRLALHRVPRLTTLLAALAPFAPGQEPVPDDTPCTLRGVLVDEAGAPVPGVTLAASGWEANSDLVRRFGTPKNWQDPAPVTTDAEGRFVLTFVPPRAYQFTLDAAPPGLGKVGWRWHSIAPGAELDLGRTVLEPEAVLVGHIVDAQGNLLIDGWVVTANHNWNSGLNGRDTTMSRSVVDPATGQFRIEGLPPGKLRVTATSGSIRVPELDVTTQKGVETTVELRYTGPDPKRKLVVTISTRPFHPFRPAEDAVHAIAADGTRIALVPEPRRANDWYVPDIAPGVYRVEVRDPRFIDWSQDGVAPGQAARARLEGSAALRVRVVDGDTGVPVEAFALDIGFRGVNFSPNVFRVREADAAPPAGGLYRGIVPGDLTVEVIAAGWPNARTLVDALAPGETRDVEVRLVRAQPLRGRVVDTAGRPIAGVSVQATRGEVPGHDRPDGGTSTISGSANGKSFQVEVRYRDAGVTTAEDGTFTLDGLGAGTYTLLSDLGRFLEVVTRVTLPSDAPVTLTAPASGLVSIRLLLPEGTDTARLGVSVHATTPGEVDHLRSARRGFTDQLWRPTVEGEFPAERLPLGRHQLSLLRVTTDEFGSSTDGILTEELEVVGDAEVVLDLRERFPVECALTPSYGAHVGPKAPWVHWTLVSADGGRTGFNVRSVRFGDAPSPGAAFAAPGTYTLRASGSGFEWDHPTPVVVARGAANTLTVELPLVAREVRVVDAEGAPRAKALVAYWTARGARVAAEADEAGVVALVLPEGELSLALLPTPPTKPDDEDTRALRRAGFAPRVPPEVLQAAVAGATLRFGPGEGALEARL